MPLDVSIIGLGRVGLPLALSFADRGLDVVGVDREPRVLELVGDGRMPFQETGTQELLERVLPTGRRFTSKAGKACKFPLRDPNRRARNRGEEQREETLLLNPCEDAEPMQHRFAYVGNDLQVMQKIGDEWKYAGKWGVDIKEN